MPFRKWAVGLAWAAVFPAAALAQAKTAAPKPATAVEKDARRLIEMMGTRKLGVAAASRMLQQLKPVLLKDLPTGERSEKLVATFEKKLLARLDSDEVITRTIPVYTRALSHEEIKGLIKFFESPLGARYVQVMPELMQGVDAAFQQWGAEFLPEIIAELEKEFADLMAK